MSRSFVVTAPRARRRVAPSALACLFAVASASAQTIDPRVVAAFGPDCKPVREPAIAAGQHKVIAPFMEGGVVSTHRKGHYAIYDIQSGIWSEGTVAMGIYVDLADPSIAYDPQSCDFVMVGVGFDGLSQDVVVARYDAQDCVTGDGSFSPWTAVHEGVQFEFDKPWIVAGEPAEYYLVYSHIVGPTWRYAYRRSTDGGVNWQGGDITVAGQPVFGIWPSQPTVAGAGPLYIAYMRTNSRIRFLSGQDQPNDLVSFTQLTAGLWQTVAPLEVLLNAGGDIDTLLPGMFLAKRTPQLAADPNNADTLYLVYHDTATADPNDKDVNIYLRKLTRLLGSIWSVGGRVKVNNDVTPYESDQFLPSVTVDDQGRIHIIFYDDRNYNLTSDQEDNSPDPKFDVYYAFSDDQGAGFTNFELYGIPPAPALEFGLTGSPFANPGEYIGISFYERGPATEVWTSFTGTSTQDPCLTDKSVIFSSRIVP